jgi:hypothetical protein
MERVDSPPATARDDALLRWTAAALMVGVLGGGCALVPPSTVVPAEPAAVAPASGQIAVASAAAAAAASTASTAARPAARPTPPATSPAPFATVIKDARQVDGLFTVWQKDDKVWFELKPEDFGKPFFFGPKIAQGIGESRLFGGLMVGSFSPFGRQQLVEFRRVHNQVQLIARNTRFAAPAGTPGARAVQAGFSASLIGSSPVASQPHPDRKSVLVEANPMVLSDLLGMGIQLQRTYRQNYAFDRGNSAIARVRNAPGELVLEVQAHYATANLGQAQPNQPASLAPSQPRTLPDARSLFFGFHYAFAALPAQPMTPRRADARVGYFTTNVADYGDDVARSPQQRFVNRWRLEKRDPAAPLSEPVKPITFWIDRTVPVKYRQAVTDGVLAWNAAFERIGFRHAVVVKVQPDDADFDTLDIGAASIRWLASANAAFGATGPSQVDPRSGEILDADIAVEGLNWRAVRTIRTDYLNRTGGADWAALMQLPDAQAPSAAGAADAFAVRPAPSFARCEHGEHMAESLAYALDVLDARGELDPGSPQTEAFVRDSIVKTTMHEVGHALGLRHNFRSSRIYTLAQLADADFVKANGIAGSVMEYPPIHLAAPGAKAVPAFGSVLGPYDYWAIEYAYKPMPPGSTPDQEEAELQRIAARSAEPQLGYATDEDASLGIDPDALTFDLSDDAVGFAALRIDIARDLIRRQSTRDLTPDADYSVLRRSVSFALRDMARAGGILARQIGGVRTLRDHPGSGRDPLQPVDAELQRRALDLLSRHFMAADAVTLPPALQRRLAPDFQARTDALFAGDAIADTDFSLPTVLLDMQRTLLNQLLSDGVAQRIIDSEGKSLQPGDTLRLSELYDRLGRDLWSELDARGADIAAPRRELQREHVRRLTASLVRPSGQGRADARSLLRQQALALVSRIDAARRHKGLSAEAAAHLADVADQLRQGLQAGVQRPV